MKRIHTTEHLTDEQFVARLGIISIQNRIAPSNAQGRRWVSRFQIGDSTYHVEGYAADFGRPRGVDTDVQLAIETLFLSQGCPRDNVVCTTAYELLTISNSAKKGTNYSRLHESLMRLWRVGFMVSQARYESDSPWATYSNSLVSLYHRIDFVSAGFKHYALALTELVKDATLRIQLSHPLAESIRAGHTQMLDRKLLAQIEQPAGRGMYRILQAHRPSKGPLEVSLNDWGAACGVLNDQPDKIRRALQTAHEELIANAYLDGVEYLGRGSEQKVTYHYREDGAADPALVQLLQEQNIPQSRAERLAQQYPDRIEQVVQYVQQRRAQGRVKSPGGLTVDILLNPEKYELMEVPPSQDAQQSLLLLAKRAQEEMRKVEADHAEQQAVLLSLPDEQQWESCHSTLKILLSKVLSSKQWEKLEEKCRSGQIKAASLTRELSSTVVKEERQRRVLELLAG